MAAKIHGPEFGESSRFSVLANNDSEESQEENDGHKIDEAKKKAKNAKKRARKKKKAAEDSAATAELRKMAFGEPSKHDKHPKTKGNVAPTLEEKPPLIDVDWVERDEQFVVNQFHEDLEEALQLSLEEANHQKQLGTGLAVKKKKIHPIVKLSLDEFQQQPVEPDVNDVWGDNREKGFDEMQSTIENLPKKSKKTRKKKEEIAEKGQKVQEIDEIMKGSTSPPGLTYENLERSLELTSLYQLMNKVENKDKEIVFLKSTVTQLKEELAGMKKRNKQLCVILGQGEMRDKSEILLQVDDLTNVKDELSSEITKLRTLLEQERSKVSALKIDLAKFQTGRSKKQSGAENGHR